MNGSRARAIRHGIYAKGEDLRHGITYQVLQKIKKVTVTKDGEPYQVDSVSRTLKAMGKRRAYKDAKKKYKEDRTDGRA